MLCPQTAGPAVRRSGRCGGSTRADCPGARGLFGARPAPARHRRRPPRACRRSAAVSSSVAAGRRGHHGGARRARWSSRRRPSDRRRRRRPSRLAVIDHRAGDLELLLQRRGHAASRATDARDLRRPARGVGARDHLADDENGRAFADLGCGAREAVEAADGRLRIGRVPRAEHRGRRGGIAAGARSGHRVPRRADASPM